MGEWGSGGVRKGGLRGMDEGGGGGLGDFSCVM